MSAALSQAVARPEHQLLLYSARTSLRAEAIEHLRFIAASEFDWDYFFLLARRHAVLPLVYRQLQNSVSDLIPAEQLARLKKHYQENAARNVVLTSELVRLIRLFADSQIEAIPYKGPLLAQFAYNDIALRRFVDLDVMVLKEDVSKAREILLQEGYLPAKALTAAQQQVLLRTQHNIQFIRDDRKFIVELHWEVASHLFVSSVNAEELWENLVSTELLGATIKTLSTEDLLFSLCVHGSRHLWEKLSWVCDVAELVARHEIDWSKLIRRTEHTDSARMFFLGLRLAHDLLEANLPASISESITADKHITSLASAIAERWFSGSEHVPASSREIFRYNIEVRRSWRARARYVVFMLRPTDGDLGAVKLPRGFGFAYYLMRPFRLLTKHT